MPARSGNTRNSFAEKSSSKTNKKKQETNIKEKLSLKELQTQLVLLEQEMQKAAENLDFEKAIALRDQWYSLKKNLL